MKYTNAGQSLEALMALTLFVSKKVKKSIKLDLKLE